MTTGALRSQHTEPITRPVWHPMKLIPTLASRLGRREIVAPLAAVECLGHSRRAQECCPSWMRTFDYAVGVHGRVNYEIMGLRVTPLVMSQ